MSEDQIYDYCPRCGEGFESSGELRVHVDGCQGIWKRFGGSVLVPFGLVLCIAYHYYRGYADRPKPELWSDMASCIMESQRVGSGTCTLRRDGWIERKP